MSQWEKLLLCKRGGLSSDPQKPRKAGCSCWCLSSQLSYSKTDGRQTQESSHKFTGPRASHSQEGKQRAPVLNMVERGTGTQGHPLTSTDTSTYPSMPAQTPTHVYKDNRGREENVVLIFHCESQPLLCVTVPWELLGNKDI